MPTSHKHPYWLGVPPLTGSKNPPDSGGITIIGSGLAGVSTAYWLQRSGLRDITLLDFELEKAATFRNCGHILNGTVESMQALVELHGKEKAKAIWQFSVKLCEEVGRTVRTLGIACDYAMDGYLVLAIDEAEDREVKSSIALLTELGFASEYRDRASLEKLGFKNVFGGRFEPTSAQAHPVKFRNGLLAEVLKNGARYYSGVEVTACEESSGKVVLTTRQHGKLHYDACVIAANAYSPLLSEFFASRRLVEPFRGQILTSAPLKHPLPVRYPHSFDHGYEYALVTPDNRLMIGGWRNKTASGEVGTYDLTPNPDVEDGLKAFTKKHYAISEAITWEYSWSGIMAASQTGFPFIGPTDSQIIFTVSGFTGHGFSWAHGSAKLLADIMLGNKLPAVASYFNPRIL